MVAPICPLPTGKAYSIQVSLTPVAVAGMSYQREQSWMSEGLVPFLPTQNSAGTP